MPYGIKLAALAIDMEGWIFSGAFPASVICNEAGVAQSLIAMSKMAGSWNPRIDTLIAIAEARDRLERQARMDKLRREAYELPFPKPETTLD